jgi:hypothetical protein
MKFKFVVTFVGLTSLFGAATQAQERQTIDIGVSYSYVRYNPATAGFKSFSMNGGSGSVAYNFKSWLSGVADVGGYSKHNILGNGVDGSLSTYLFGPRVSHALRSGVGGHSAHRRPVPHDRRQPNSLCCSDRRGTRLALD